MIIKYLVEFKNRFLLIFITYFSTVLAAYFYKEILLFLIIQPNYYYYANTDKVISAPYFIFTAVTEIFSVYMQLIICISFQICIIFSLYHAFIFFSFALFAKEYKLLKQTFKTILYLWGLSAFISNYFIIPLTWQFFLSFQDLLTTNSFNIYFEAKIIEYFYFYIYFYYICIIYFQVIGLFFFAFTYFSISLKNIKKLRKLYYFGFVLFSTALSPDILSQCFISVFLILFYEVFVLFFIFSKNLNSIIKCPLR